MQAASASPVKTPALGRRDARRGRLTRGASDAVAQLAGLVNLAGSVIRCWVTPPFDWRGEAIDQGWVLVRRTIVPAMLSLFFFGMGAVAIQGGGALNQLGTVDRMGTLFSVASLREFVPW